MSLKQEEFLTSEDKRINILTGSVRSGKTWASLLKWALFVGNSPEKADYLMAGNTAGTLERNCFGVLTEIVGKSNFGYSQHLMRGELFGRRIWLMGAGDISCEGKIRGMTLMGAYLDELTLLRREYFMTLLSRLSQRGAALFATTNPDGPTHWVMADIINNEEMDRAVWNFEMTDNVFLPKEYVEAIKGEYGGVFYERYVLGRWTACEGTVYRDFAERKEEFFTKEAGRFGEINVGVDFGGNKSAHAFAACGMSRGSDKKISLFALASRRIPAADTDTKRLFDEIIAFLRFVAEKYGGDGARAQSGRGAGGIINVFCDSAEPVLIRGLRRAVAEAGLPFAARVRPARKRRIRDRIIGTLAVMAGKRFFYTSDCASLENALTSALWKNDGERLDDGSVDVDSLDAFEYAWERDLERIV